MWRQMLRAFFFRDLSHEPPALPDCGNRFGTHTGSRTLGYPRTFVQQLLALQTRACSSRRPFPCGLKNPCKNGDHLHGSFWTNGASIRVFEMFNVGGAPGRCPTSSQPNLALPSTLPHPYQNPPRFCRRERWHKPLFFGVCGTSRSSCSGVAVDICFCDGISLTDRRSLAW